MAKGITSKNSAPSGRQNQNLKNSAMNKIKAYVNNHELMVNEDQTHVYVDGEWVEISEDQEGGKYFILNKANPKS